MGSKRRNEPQIHRLELDPATQYRLGLRVVFKMPRPVEDVVAFVVLRGHAPTRVDYSDEKPDEVVAYFDEPTRLRAILYTTRD